jgi:hypothetical protein
MILESPFVSSREILDSYRPGQPTGEKVLRRLREKGFVSDGLVVPARLRSGRLGGSFRLYCTLNRDAARLARRGEEDEARIVSVRAREIEQTSEAALLVDAFARFAAHDAENTEAVLRRSLVTMNYDHALERAVAALAEEIDEARQTTKVAIWVVRLHGTLERLTDEMATIVDDEGREIALPARDLAERGLDFTGAPITVCWEHAGRGQIITEAQAALLLEARPFLEKKVRLSARESRELEALARSGPTVTRPAAVARPA